MGSTSAVSGTSTAAVTPDLTATQSVVTESQAPSHILQDGRFGILPEPSPAERRRYLERSIARHGLLQKDLKLLQSSRTTEDAAAQHISSLSGGGTTDDPDADGDATTKEEDNESAPKVHPLVIASARLQNDGINELNRAINLASLVHTSEYFGLSNIVADSALELASNEAEASKERGGGGGGSDATKKSGDGEAAAGGASAPTAASAAASQASKSERYESQRIAATYVLKRKYAQFRQSSFQLKQHRDRMQSAIVAEHRPLNRLRALRLQWRLVAPEHGTRAAPHAARPTEVLAADIDLYHSSQPGRLARRVPRYATVELCDDYKVDHDVVAWNAKMKHWAAGAKANTTTSTNSSLFSPHKGHHHHHHHHKKKDGHSKTTTETTSADGVVKDETTMDTTPPVEPKIEAPEISSGAIGSGMDPTIASAAVVDEEYNENALWTRAEPFAIADPTLGKIDADFDPTRVAMLTLEFSIERPEGGRTFASLQPFASSIKAAPDTKVLVALQHSLFCSKMFDAIRREVASDTQEVGQVRTNASQSERATIWLSTSAATNAHTIKNTNQYQFLPPPGSMVMGEFGSGQPVTVIHCHEGEVMVQLDCEYTLRIKLVEAVNTRPPNNNQTKDDEPPAAKKIKFEAEECKPGEDDANDVSSSVVDPSRHLLALCQALMLHAQEIYHQHMIQQDKIQKLLEEEEAAAQRPFSGLAVKRKTPELKSPYILQKCICLGSKILMERRIRSALESVERWTVVVQQQQQSSSQQQQQQPILQLHTEWLPLSALDTHGQFTTSLIGTNWYVDVHLFGDRITVTSFDVGTGGYRKVDFYSVEELDLFLRRAIWNQIRPQPQPQQQPPTTTTFIP